MTPSQIDRAAAGLRIPRNIVPDVASAGKLAALQASGAACPNVPRLVLWRMLDRARQILGRGERPDRAPLEAAAPALDPRRGPARAAEDRDLARRALEGLPCLQRLALIHCEALGVQRQEFARAFGVSPSAVTLWLREGRARAPKSG